MRPFRQPAYVDPADHAFASGPVFLKGQGGSGFDRLLHPRLAGRIGRVWAQFERGAEIGREVRLGLAARLINRNRQSRVRIGEGSVIRGILRNERSGEIALGRRVYVGDGVILSAMASITIGDETLIAHGVQMFDNDTHPIDAEARAIDFRRKLGEKLPEPVIASAAITIGRRCWLGMHSLVMKGVAIGDETIVASGSVVTSDLPAGVIAGGNPARCLRSIDKEAA